MEISAISGGSVTLSNGCVIDDVDAVLLGTGYGGPKYHRNLDMHDDTPFWCKVCGAQAVFSQWLGEERMLVSSHDLFLRLSACAHVRSLHL